MGIHATAYSKLDRRIQVCLTDDLFLLLSESEPTLWSVKSRYIVPDFSSRTRRYPWLYKNEERECNKYGQTPPYALPCDAPAMLRVVAMQNRPQMTISGGP
jgi:hypothetical protein